jgi:hypothetical protein
MHAHAKLASHADYLEPGQVASVASMAAHPLVGPSPMVATPKKLDYNATGRDCCWARLLPMKAES